MKTITGSPELQLWAEVAHTLIVDSKSELNSCISLREINEVQEKWSNRAKDPSYGYIIHWLDIKQRDVVKIGNM